MNTRKYKEESEKLRDAERRQTAERERSCSLIHSIQKFNIYFAMQWLVRICRILKRREKNMEWIEPHGNYSQVDQLCDL